MRSHHLFLIPLKLFDKKGSSLVITYFVIVVLSAFGAAFAIMSANEASVAERQRKMAQAFAIAEAGIERAIYDLRQDFLNDSTDPSFLDGTIDSFTIGPDTSNFYTIPYASSVTSLGAGSFTVQLKNITGSKEEVWVESTGTVGGTSQTLQAYIKMVSVSPWANAIFAGAGASGAAVNGNVNIRGSVHILGSGLDPTDFAVDLGGTAELVGNNFSGLAAGLAAKVPALPTTVFGGETVSTLNAKLRVKKGVVGISGSSSVGESNVTGNSVKETIDASYATNGFGGTQGTNRVYSDNGWSNGYDLGDTVAFPNLSDPYGAYSSYQAYLQANALVISDAGSLNTLANMTPNSNFTFSSANGSISMDGSGSMAISGIVYIDGGSLNINVDGSDKTVTYSGKGSILSTGNVGINVNLVTNGNNSFPSNIIGIMTPGTITFNEANIDVMGVFYAQTQITSQKQTDIVGTFVSNYFDMGTNVPSIFQVPAVVNSLPPGLIGQSGNWVTKVVSWQRL